jgi:hypothetical protein
MKRIIKYRVWNTVRKEFSFIELFNGKKNIDTTIDVLRSRNFEHPQQFVGLGKNGKEIYEGDYLKCGEGYCTVEFIDGNFSFSNCEHWLDEWNWADDSGRFEVIGNTYETSEDDLLKLKNKKRKK